MFGFDSSSRQFIFNALSKGSNRYQIRWHCNALQIVNRLPVEEAKVKIKTKNLRLKWYTWWWKHVLFNECIWVECRKRNSISDQQIHLFFGRCI